MKPLGSKLTYALVIAIIFSMSAYQKGVAFREVTFLATHTNISRTNETQNSIGLNSVPQLKISTPSNLVGMNAGESQFIHYKISETGNDLGKITSFIYQFYTQYDIPLSDPIGPYATDIDIDPRKSVEWDQLVSLPGSVVDAARAMDEYAIVLKTTFVGKSLSNVEFSTEASQLMLLSPAAFSKTLPIDGATNLSTNQSLQWESSVGAIDYEYCFDTIDNNSCDTEWTGTYWPGTYETVINLENLPLDTTFYWQVRANNLTGTTYANDGTWWSFTTQGLSIPNTVTNANDSGIGSLRQVITDANPGATITFDSSLAGQTIRLASTLTITKDLIIDGTNLGQNVQINGDTNNNAYGDVLIFYIPTGYTVELHGVDVIYGYGGNGGGILNQGNLTLTNCTLDNNRANFGGGIYNYYDATLTISNCVVSNNIAEVYGGGITNGGTLNVTNCSFLNNSADPWGSAIQTVGVSTITNSTFSQNSGAGTIYHSTAGDEVSLIIENSSFAHNSGGYTIYNYDGNASINNSTIYANLGGIYIFSDQVDISNTIVSHNFFNSNPRDCYKRAGIAMGLDSHNFFSSDESCGVAVSGYGVSLELLADNGGPTETMALKSGSPAIDAGDDVTCASNDQRGISRPQGAHCDIGAFEYQRAIAAPITPSGTLTDWNHTFSWMGLPDATWYLLEVQTSEGTQVFRNWYTSADTGCSGGTACSSTPAGLNLANGDYKWRILDYGAYGYGTNSAFLNFTLNAACYSFTASINPVGSGTVTAPAETCTGGYTAGSVVQLTAVPNIGYLFDTWSGAASGTTNPVMVTMDGDKSVTANFTASLGPIAPSGTLTSWNSSFSWTGLNNATWYLLEVQTSAGTQVFRKWYTSAQSGCSGGTACVVTEAGLSLANGNYKWRVMDYGAYGYGTNSAFKTFTLNATCYTLTTNVSPVGSGTVNAPTQNCAGGYTAGTVVQLTAVPGTGYAFSNWSGAAGGTSNPVAVVMDGDKSVTANMRGNTLIAPAGALTNWDTTFIWTGLSDATWYLLEVQTSGGTQVFRQWYTSAQTGCSGGTACSVAPTGLSLANGNYKWRVMDYGAYGYGLNSAFKTFTLNLTLACYTLTTTVNPVGSGTVNTPAQTCAGGYTAGSVIQLTAAPNTGYLFDAWSGAATGTTNPVSVTMDGAKSVTADFKPTVVLISPSGALGSWNNTFSWTGLSNATWYLLEVQTSGGAQMHRKWYTSSQTGCSGGTTCSVVPPETAGLANGDYKWRILDYGAYGYGTWTAYMNFTLNQ